MRLKSIALACAHVRYAIQIDRTGLRHIRYAIRINRTGLWHIRYAVEFIALACGIFDMR